MYVYDVASGGRKWSKCYWISNDVTSVVFLQHFENKKKR